MIRKAKILVSLNDKREAHYLSAILNSSIIAFVGTYMPVKGSENMAILKFNLNKYSILEDDH